MLNTVPLFTPIKTEREWSSLPALYLSPLLCGKEVAVFDPREVDALGNQGCKRENNDTSWALTAWKIATYILSAGILPLLAIVFNLVIRLSTKYYYIQNSVHQESQTFSPEKQAALDLVKELGENLRSLSPEFKADEDVVLAAINNSRLAFQHADPILRNTKHIVLAAVNVWGWSLKDAGPDMIKDEDIVLAAVTNWGPALKHADPILQNTKYIVLAAVNSPGNALECAGPAMKRDEGIVLASIKIFAPSIQYADPSVLKNEAIRNVLIAQIQQGELALENLLYWFGEEFEGNEEIRIVAGANEAI